MSIKKKKKKKRRLELELRNLGEQEKSFLWVYPFRSHFHLILPQTQFLHRDGPHSVDGLTG